MSTFCFGQSKKELEVKVTELNNSIAELQNQNKSLNTKIQNIETQKKELNNSVNDFRTKYENVLNDRVSQEKTISGLEKKMDSLKTSTKTSTATKSGVVKLVEFSNANASFTVPEGKNWEILNVFCQETGKYTRKVNSYNSEYYWEFLGLRIYLKELNGVILTDFSKNKIGPRFYRSFDAASSVRNMIYPEGTTFSFLIASSVSDKDVEKNGAFTLKKADSKKAYINYIEHDN